MYNILHEGETTLKNPVPQTAVFIQKTAALKIYSTKNPWSLELLVQKKLVFETSSTKDLGL